MTDLQPPFYRRLPAWAYVLIFSLGHFSVDFYAAIVTPLLEEFRSMYQLKTWQIFAYTAPATIFGSLLQPVLGVVADRFNRGLLAGIAILMTAFFLSYQGAAAQPIILTLMLTIGSVGVGMFHPSSAAAVSQISGKRRNFLMAIFIVSGMTGLASAGVVVTRFVTQDGVVQLGRTVLLMPIGVIIGLMVIGTAPFAPGVRVEDRTDSPETFRAVFRDIFSKDFGPIRILCAIACIRAFSLITFQNLVPFLAKDRGWSLEMGGGTISAQLFLLGIGGLIGGYVSDRATPRSILGISTIMPIPFLIGFALWADKGSIICFGLSGLMVGLATPVTVVFAQQLQPKRAGLVSGLMMGFAWGVSGLLMPLVGYAADVFGKPKTLVAVALLMIPASLMVFYLPRKAEAGASNQLSVKKRDSNDRE